MQQPTDWHAGHNIESLVRRQAHQEQGPRFVFDEENGEISNQVSFQWAQAAGGAVHILNGNHETMSVSGRYTYATPGAMAECARWHEVQSAGARLRVRLPLPGLRPIGPSLGPH